MGPKKILSQEEIDKLVKRKEKRVESGNFSLTKSPEEVKDSGGLGLAGTIYGQYGLVLWEGFPTLYGIRFLDLPRNYHRIWTELEVIGLLSGYP